MGRMTRARPPLLVPLLAGLACDASDDANRALQRMMQQPRADTWEAHPAFADGKAIQPPPDGTVALDAPDDAEIPDRFPVAVTHELLLRGQGRYEIACTPCHGPLGDGRAVVADNFELRRPPSLLDDRRRALSPGQIHRVIREGYGLMGAYRHLLNEQDRWAVTAYVRALQLAGGQTLNDLPAALRDEADRALK
jgi:hypothetical protein